jgi:hypothetical protein
MKVVRLLSVLCLAAPLFAQTSAPTSAPRVVRSPQIRNAQNFAVLPQVVDGLESGVTIWSTQIVLVNLNPNSGEPYTVNFYDESGNPAKVNIIDQASGGVTTISGSLNPGQTIRYTTAGLATTPIQTTWASVYNSGTGGQISAYEAIRDTVPSKNYFAETQVSCDFGIDNTATNPGGFMPFDNTATTIAGVPTQTYTSIAMVNPDLANTAGWATSLLVQIYNQNGTLIGTHTITLTSGQHTAFNANSEWPETAGIQGTLYFLPSTGTFSAITMFGLRAYNSSTYKTNATINLLQVTCPSAGCPTAP